MKEFLVPDNHTSAGQHMHDPYTLSGARSVLRRFSDDVKDMLQVMYLNHEQFDAGKTFLKASPLRHKVWVAAAMKTYGWIEERPSPNGSCALVLTEKALKQMDQIMKHF